MAIKKPKPISVNDVNIEKIPMPLSQSTEEAVLAVLLSDAKLAARTIPTLSVADFYAAKPQFLFNALKSVYDKSLPIDLLTVFAEVKHLGLDKGIDVGYIVELSNRMASGANVDAHVMLLKEYTARRQMIKMAAKILSEAADMTRDVFEMVDFAHTATFEMEETLSVSGLSQGALDISIPDMLDEHLNDSNTGKVLPMLPDETFNKLLNIPQKGGNFIFVVAKPSHGKTAFQTTVLNHLVAMGVPVYSASGETSIREQSFQFIAKRAFIPAWQIRKPFYQQGDNYVSRFTDGQKQNLVAIAKSIGGQHGNRFNRSDSVYLEFAHNVTLEKFEKTVQRYVSLGVRTFLFDRINFIAYDDRHSFNEKALEVFDRIRNICANYMVNIVVFGQPTKSGINNERLNWGDLYGGVGSVAAPEVIILIHYPYKDNPNESHPNDIFLEVVKNSRSETTGESYKMYFGRNHQMILPTIPSDGDDMFMDFRDKDSESVFSANPVEEEDFFDPFLSMPTANI
jgi:hypothetical protein